MNAILPLILVLMATLSPPGRKHYEPEAEETIEQANVRYAEIAQAAYDVSYDPEEKPLMGSREYTLAMLLAVSWHESGWRKDVDTGLGRARLSRKGWNDRGKSWCLCQVMLGKKGDDSAALTAEGWSGKELLADRRKCFRAGLHIIQKTGCARGPGFLNAYASGSCDKGLELSRPRMHTAQRIFEKIKSVSLDRREALAQ